MEEKSSLDWYQEHNGSLPLSAEIELMQMFASAMPSLMSELQGFGNETYRQLSTLLVGAQIGLLDLLANSKEKHAGKLMRWLFGKPHKEADGAYSVALQLASDEANAAGDVREAQAAMQSSLEVFAQVIPKLIDYLTQQLQLIEASILAKTRSLETTKKQQLHALVLEDKVDFVEYTDGRLRKLLRQRAEFSVKLNFLNMLLGRFATPLSRVVDELSGELVTLTKLDPSKAIPVGEVA